MSNIKVLFLSNNANGNTLYEWLIAHANVCQIKDQLSIEVVKREQPDLIISYNYSYIISKEIIDYMTGNIINLHISYLPWNRGASPNFWSFIDETPKGVTIHQVDYGLDTGKIIFQKECHFDETKESFMSTYDFLQQEIVSLFKEKWEEIKAHDYKMYNQKGNGSYHAIRDLVELDSKCPFKWEDNISEYKNRYRRYLEGI